MNHPKSTRTRPALCLAAFVFAPVVALAQTTFDWVGTTDQTWGTASNWNPATGAPPGTAATDIARFNLDMEEDSTVTLGASATIQRLVFADGAGEYDIAGERLVISSGSNLDFIVHQAGNVQTISAELELISTGSFRDVLIGAGSTLVIEKKLVFNPTGGQIRVRGGGTIEILDGFTGLNIFNIAGAGSVLEFRGNGGVNRLRADDGARINLYTSHGGDYTAAGNGASIYLRFNGIAAATGGTNSINLAPTANHTVTLGADIIGGGTGSFGRELRLFQGGTVNNATIRFDAQAGSTLNINGRIVDTNAAGTGSVVEITGDGVVRFSGTLDNTSVTPILISDGTLELAKTAGVNAIGGGTVTVQSAGLLRLAASNQIANGTALVLSGGGFSVGEFDETLGALTVDAAGGVIDFGGESGAVTFASLASIGGTLTVNGWTENATLTFTDGSAWDAAALQQVVFTGYGAAQFDSVTGVLSAIPEPGAAAWLFGLAGLAGAAARRRPRTD